MITIKKLHNDVPKAIKHLKQDSRPVKGSHIIPDCNSAIFLVAKRNSGKTTTVFKIIQSCISKDTTVIIFCANLYRDKSYAVIRKWFKDKNIPFMGYTNIIEDGVNKLQELNDIIKEKAEELAEEAEMEEEEELIPQKKYACCFADDDDDEEENEKKKSKKKYRTPEYIILFDDMSDQLKGSTLESLLKNSRHFSRVIISTQYIHDISIGSRKQIDYWLIFKSNRDKLPVIHKDADLSLPFDIFQKLYDHAVDQPYSFLFVDTKKEEYRINFNKQIKIPKDLFN